MLVELTPSAQCAVAARGKVQLLHAFVAAIAGQIVIWPTGKQRTEHLGRSRRVRDGRRRTGRQADRQRKHRTAQRACRWA
ncbi:hypothetical protein XavaCFBP5823_12985 [Xanthomonas axonopodis pv. vasculorum]|nr:hypothetical protein XavaCFBP5823_12985 [Xanthomonas axonopodis pv. vasculorum]